MADNKRYEHGETLVEVLFALVIIGLVVGAYLSTYSTTALASKANRNLVTADQLLRDYAETAKQAVQKDCTTHTTFTTTTTSVPGFNVTATSSLSPATACPSTTAAPLLNELTFRAAITPGSVTKQLVIDVRTP